MTVLRRPSAVAPVLPMQHPVSRRLPRRPPTPRRAGRTLNFSRERGSPTTNMRPRCSGPNCRKTTRRTAASISLVCRDSGDRTGRMSFGLWRDPCFARSPSLLTPAHSLFPMARLPHCSFTKADVRALLSATGQAKDWVAHETAVGRNTIFRRRCLQGGMV